MIAPQHLQGVTTHTGFPNPAIDTSLQGIDLNKELINHRVSTYFMRVASDRWTNLAIAKDSVLIIDKALRPLKNDLVVWHDGGQFDISPLHAMPSEAALFGVISSIVNQLRKPS